MRKETGLLLVLLIMLAPLSMPASGKKVKHDGAKLFSQYCASCHVGGGNKIKPAKSIAGSKELENFLAFKSYLSVPPGHMPYYHDLIGNREKLTALYEYCKSNFKEKAQTQSYAIDKDERLAAR
ncbi:MAG: c-type cytochrome [Cyanobacteria bacterium]|nr:c-type cytochrome [Cyanobacteriota bacterium]